MFAYSLTRGGWLKAGNHNEQICSCKVNATEGNCGSSVSVCGTGWRPCYDHMRLPFTTVIILLCAHTHRGDRCLSLSTRTVASCPPESNSRPHPTSRRTQRKKEETTVVLRKQVHRVLKMYCIDCWIAGHALYNQDMKVKM